MFHMPNKNCIFCKIVPSLECGLIKRERERERERESEIDVEKPKIGVSMCVCE